jgi:hypothetical protein
MMARSLDNDNYVLVSSLNLSSAFEVVKIDLLLQRLKIIALPEDIITLISFWLRVRITYASIGCQNPIWFDLLMGTVQGSILGPILYIIFVSLIFDLEFVCFC